MVAILCCPLARKKSTFLLQDDKENGLRLPVGGLGFHNCDIFKSKVLEGHPITLRKKKVSWYFNTRANEALWRGLHESDGFCFPDSIPFMAA